MGYSRQRRGSAARRRLCWVLNDLYDFDDPGNLWKGQWVGTFTLPDTHDNSTVHIETWWSTGCGNNSAVNYSIGGPHAARVIPLASSLLSCGIGVGFMALLRGAVRQRFSRSQGDRGSSTSGVGRSQLRRCFRFLSLSRQNQTKQGASRFFGRFPPCAASSPNGIIR